MSPRNKPTYYSSCCNAYPVHKEPTKCSKCFELTIMYDPEDTMTVEEYNKEQMFNNDSKFDIDLKYGQIREQLFADIMTGKEKVEIKTERGKWQETGNIAIEWASRGKKSGIATTEADWWVHFLNDGEDTKAIIMMPVETLKNVIKKRIKRGILTETRGGDDDTSRLALLPLNELFGDV